MKIVRLGTPLLLVLFSCVAARAVTIPTVTIGNPGNPADPRLAPLVLGSVSYDYRIGKTEVTNAQYVEFLNAVAASDPYELYDTSMGSSSRAGITRSISLGSYTYSVKPDAVGQGLGGLDYTYADKPVVHVSWYDAVRFANWMHNGMGSGDTEDGAYTLLGGTPTPSNELSITRNPSARWWLPSEDEWYKAAYHKNDGVTGNYWDYPTGTNSVPNNNLPSADTGNSANFQYSDHTGGNPSYPLTDAGAYTLSGSSYGTFDQGGNVSEWNEPLTGVPVPPPLPPSKWRRLRGGSWNDTSTPLYAFERYGSDPSDQHGGKGFRVASIVVPEPTGAVLALAAAVVFVGRRRRR